MPLAITLIVLSFLSAFLLASFSRSTTSYWTASADLPAGHQISANDVELKAMNLGDASNIYLAKERSPIGQVVISSIEQSGLISSNSVSSAASGITSSAVPINVRSVDLAMGIQTGSLVDIYWVIDTQNGELPQDPILVLGGILVLSADGKSKNFGTDAAVTVSVEHTQVLRLLAATTVGRLVVISTHV